jgi:hypothetical protein
MTINLNLTNFSNTNPPWTLSQLDANFNAIGTAITTLSNVTTTGTFVGTVSGTISGTVSFNYAQISQGGVVGSVGSINWIWSYAGLTANATPGQPLITVSGMPQIITPNVTLQVAGGPVINGNGTYLGNITVNGPNNAFILGVMVSLANGVGPGFGFSGGVCGMPANFAFSYPSI